MIRLEKTTSIVLADTVVGKTVTWNTNCTWNITFLSCSGSDSCLPSWSWISRKYFSLSLSPPINIIKENKSKSQIIGWLYMIESSHIPSILFDSTSAACLVLVTWEAISWSSCCCCFTSSSDCDRWMTSSWLLFLICWFSKTLSRYIKIIK